MRPTLKSTIALFVAGAVFFVLSASGQPNSLWKTGPSWLGWLGFLICVPLLVVLAVWAIVSRIRHRELPAQN